MLDFNHGGPCLAAELRGGLGNWLYISVEVALAAAATNRTLALPSVLHAHFNLPADVKRVTPECQRIRHMQHTSESPRLRKMATRALGEATFAQARAKMFRHLFASPRAPTSPALPKVGIAVHLRTVTDVHCKTYTDIRSCRQSCIRSEVLVDLARMIKTTLPHRPIVVMSDSRRVSKQLIAQFGTGEDIHDESWLANASDHSGFSKAAGHRAIRLWIAFSRANVRVASSPSSFSKSALLSVPNPNSRDYVVDPRCAKAHHSDGDLFTYRRASLTDLV
jgi:uncharacterized membrane protein